MALAAIAPLVLAPRLTTRVISGYDEFLALESQWTDLVRRSGASHPFLEHCWLCSWWDCFGDGSQLRIVTVREGQRLIAAAPLILTTTRIYGVPVRRLGFFYNPHVPRADFIIAERAEEACEAIWAELRAASDWDVIQLCQLTESSDTLPRIRELAHRDRLPIGTWKSGASPRVQIDRTFDQFHQTLAAKFRSNLRNRFKRLDQVGTVALDTVTGGSRLKESLDEGLRLEASGWKGEEGTAILNDARIQRFYELFAERAAERGWLRLNFLRVNGRAAAFDYSLEYANRIFLQKLGHDPEFSALSPSNLLLCTALRQAFERGLAEYDFLGEEAEWKRCWTEEAQSNYWLYIFANTAKGRLAHWLKFEAAPKLKEDRTVIGIMGAVREMRRKASGKRGSTNR